METEITSLSSTALENSTDSLALIFSSKYAPSTIELGDPVHEDVGQIEKTIERFSSRGRFANTPLDREVTRKMQRLKVKVPYSGEKHLLMKRPRRLSSVPTYNELDEDMIVHYVDYQAKGESPESIKETIDNDISKWRKKLEDCVKNLNRDIQRMQESFEDDARRFVDEHRENMSAKDEALAELGISTETGKEGFVIPDNKKEIDLPDLDVASEEKQRVQDATFVSILDIIESFRVDVERAKQSVRDLDEEGLRDVFLGAINATYGSATAESYNRGGKTDILLRYKGVNLFVAECKFWTGKKEFHDAVDQLLGNLTVDDEFTSLLIFSDRKNFVQVRDKVGAAVESHSNFQGESSRFEDHDVYRFSIPSGTEVKIAVKVVDLGC